MKPFIRDEKIWVLNYTSWHTSHLGNCGLVGISGLGAITAPFISSTNYAITALKGATKKSENIVTNYTVIASTGAGQHLVRDLLIDIGFTHAKEWLNKSHNDGVRTCSILIGEAHMIRDHHRASLAFIDEAIKQEEESKKKEVLTLENVVKYYPAIPLHVVEYLTKRKKYVTGQILAMYGDKYLDFPLEERKRYFENFYGPEILKQYNEARKKLMAPAV